MFVRIERKLVERSNALAQSRKHCAGSLVNLTVFETSTSPGQAPEGVNHAIRHFEASLSR